MAPVGCGAARMSINIDLSSLVYTPTGSLPFTPRLLESAGPVSDAFIDSAAAVSVIVGPVGSGKTTASIKKIMFEARRIRPDPATGLRRYVIGIWRQKYDNLWKTTIHAWQRLFPEKLEGSDWKGASPRAASHVLKFNDGWGDIQIEAHFLAFGESADPDDLRGFEFTDVYLNEIDTMPEDLFLGLIGRIGRDPPRSITGRQGRIFGDMNAPDVTNWTYPVFYEGRAIETEGQQFTTKLFKQPHGFHPDAENIATIGRDYYLQQQALYAKKPWWIRRMIYNRPGFTRDNAVVYPEYDDDRNLVRGLTFEKDLPLIVGMDAGLTPAAVFMQEMPDGQARVLAEITTDGASETTFARAITALIERRFRGAEAYGVCDPAAKAGEETEDGSWRGRMQKHLGFPVRLASTNDTGRRWASVRQVLERSLSEGRPGLAMDPGCFALRRGFNQTYHFHKTRGTNNLSSVKETFETHVHDALQYACLELGSARARVRREQAEADRRQRREKARKNAGRYNPLTRKRA